MKSTIKIFIMLFGCLGISYLHAAAAAAVPARAQDEKIREEGAMMPPSHFDKRSIRNPTLFPLAENIIGHATNPFTNTLYVIVRDSANPTQTQIWQQNLLTRKRELCRNLPPHARQIHIAKNKLIVVDYMNTVFSIDPSNHLNFEKIDYPITDFFKSSGTSCNISPSGNHIIFKYNDVPREFLILDVNKLSNSKKIKSSAKIKHPGWTDNDHIDIVVYNETGYSIKNYSITTLFSERTYHTSNPGTSPLAVPEEYSLVDLPELPRPAPENQTKCFLLNLNHPESAPDVTSVEIPDHTSEPGKIIDWGILGRNRFNNRDGRTYANITDEYIYRGREKGIEVRKLTATGPSNHFLIPHPKNIRYISRWTPVCYGAVISAMPQNAHQYNHDLYLLSWPSPLLQTLDYGKDQTKKETTTGAAASLSPKAAAKKEPFAIAPSASAHSAISAETETPEDIITTRSNFTDEAVRRSAFERRLELALNPPAPILPNVLISPAKGSTEASSATEPPSPRSTFARASTHQPAATIASISSPVKKNPSTEDIKKAALKKKLIFFSAAATAAFVGFKIATKIMNSPKGR